MYEVLQTCTVHTGHRAIDKVNSDPPAQCDRSGGDYRDYGVGPGPGLGPGLGQTIVSRKTIITQYIYIYMYPTMPILLLLLSQFPVTVPLLRIIWLLGIWFGPVPSHYILSVFIPPRSAPPPTNIRSDQIRTRTRTGTRAREHGNEQAQCFEKKKGKERKRPPRQYIITGREVMDPS